MVGDYISRETAIEALVGLTIYDNAPALNAAVEKEYHNGREWIGGVRDALIEFGDLPAADVVEVVRCRECENWDTDWVPSHAAEGQYFCPILGQVTDTDFYCGCGKRKDGGGPR